MVLRVRWVLDLSLVIWLVAGAASPAAAQALSARKAAEAAMLKADRDFNQAMADRNIKRFLSFVAEDATFNTDRGRAAVEKAWAPFFTPEGPKLTWAPTKAESLVGADIGITIGTWQRRTKAADGTTKTTRGHYLTVWQKQKDGSWQASYDNGSTAP